MTVTAKLGTSSLPGFDRRARAMVKDMLDHGWTGRVSSKGHWIGRSPDGTATIAVARNMDAPNRARQNTEAEWTRWKRAQHPVTVAVVDASGDALLAGDFIAADILARGAAKHLEADMAELAVEPPSAIYAVPDRTVVRSEPWHAHKAPSPTGGTKYRSEAVVERQWSDGAVDYLCALEGCGYTSDVARSVSSHYAAHTRRGDTRPASGAAVVDLVPGLDYVEHLTSREYQPTDRLLDALTAFLDEMGTMETRDLARAFLTWAHERPDLEPVEREPRTLTAEEIVERIRLLAWSPIAGEVAEANRRAEKATLEAEEARVERDAIAARMVSVERDLATVREIMGEIGK